MIAPFSKLLLLTSSLRGGGAIPVTPPAAPPLQDIAKQAALLKDYSASAAEYFGGIRTPASLIVGASLGALFTDTNVYDEDAPQEHYYKIKTRAERLCIWLYNASVLLAFMLSLCTVVTATAAGVTILHGDFDPKAASAYLLLSTVFEYEFMVVRLSYLYSLLSFMVGITNRALLEFRLLKPERRNGALAICFGMAALVLHLWSYINCTLHETQNLAGMTIRLARLVLRRAFYEHKPLQLLSLVFMVAACHQVMHLLMHRSKNLTIVKGK